MNEAIAVYVDKWGRFGWTPLFAGHAQTDFCDACIEGMRQSLCENGARGGFRVRCEQSTRAYFAIGGNN